MKFPKGNRVFHNLQANHLVRVRLCIAGKRDASKRLQRWTVMLQYHKTLPSVFQTGNVALFRPHQRELKKETASSGPVLPPTFTFLHRAPPIRARGAATRSSHDHCSSRGEDHPTLTIYDPRMVSVGSPYHPTAAWEVPSHVSSSRIVGLPGAGSVLVGVEAPINPRSDPLPQEYL
jgi:hypothetical protein